MILTMNITVFFIFLQLVWCFNPSEKDLRISLLLDNISPTCNINFVEKSSNFLRNEAKFQYILKPLESQLTPSIDNQYIDYLPESLGSYYTRMKTGVLSRIELLKRMFLGHDIYRIYLVKTEGLDYIMLVPTNEIELLDIINWVNKYQSKNFGKEFWCTKIYGYQVRFAKVGVDPWKPCS
ncbi:hypothetical protein CLIB1444_03S09736 [[Candida] jaroonii]|uniref:Uncharacterized protein n=1 Tax=[Candida] jaroonii TaxID=467808 RepID=A0ACA9Y5W6_9ASCO|nr:hypothetical protein CLIB1444_03S09736 [[Candida] jaroonii]